MARRDLIGAWHRPQARPVRQDVRSQRGERDDGHDRARCGHAQGLPQNQQPPVGSYFVFGDRDYKGTSTHHAKGVFGYDHIVCTVVDLNSHARCNANTVVRNGAIYATNFMLDVQATTTVITTGLFGTGVYRHVSSITNTNFPNGTAELVIRY